MKENAPPSGGVIQSKDNSLKPQGLIRVIEDGGFNDFNGKNLLG
jgi:hypothetical protein